MKIILHLFIILLFVSACSKRQSSIAKLPQNNNQTINEKKKLEAEVNTAKEMPTDADDTELEIVKANEAPRVKSKKGKTNKTEATALFSIEVLAAEDLPPVKGVYVKLMIRNNHKMPMWYLLPRAANQSLGTSSKLVAQTNRKQPFNSKLYKGTINEQNEGQLIEVTMYGDNSKGFKAFYVPPMSSITFRNYEINEGELVENMELWSATELWVNSKKPLEDWLPYEVLSDANVKVHCNKNSGCDWDNLDWDDNADKARTDYPKETVSYIQAKSPKKHYISLKGIEH